MDTIAAVGIGWKIGYVTAMGVKTSIQWAAALGVLLVFSAMVLCGCRSTPKVDWNQRIGNYTYDQAVAELGPPDKTAKLSDGATVADWITHRHGGGVSFGVGTGFYGGGSAVGTGVGTSTGYPDRVLRLSFGVDGKLQSVRQIN